MKKKIIFTIVIGLVILGIYFGFVKKEEPDFTLFEVSRGDVFQEISETGQVQRGEEINLSFKNTGRIEQIYVEVGDEVLAGQPLIKLETDQLHIQLKEAEAIYEAQKAKLIELQKGTRPEEIQISQTLLDKAKTDLDNLYKDADVILNQVYNSAENTIRQNIASLFSLKYPGDEEKSYYELTYRYCNDSAANESAYRRKLIETDLKNWSKELESLNVESTTSLEDLISKSENYLKELQEFLNILNETFIVTCNLSAQEIDILNNYKSIVSSALGNINSSLDSLLNHSKTLKAQKLTVQNYQEELNLKLAGATPEQISYQEAQVRQAEARVALLRTQIEDAILKSSTKGKITRINKKIGEIVQPALAEAIISLLPDAPLQIKVDIYEEDIAKIEVGNSVKITLAAFPDKILNGRVVFIDPAEKLIDQVVYYEVTIDLEDVPERVKPGMTADVLIQTAGRKNILIVPKTAIEREDDKSIVRVLKEKTIEEREVEVGLRGDDMAGILSGLKEGEKVIVK